MTSTSKNGYIGKLDDIVDKYNSTYHITTKMKTVDVKSSTYIGSSKGNNNKIPKFKIDDIVRISKYKNTFAKGYIPNWSEEGFLIKEVKQLHRGMLLMILTEKKYLEHFTKTNCKKEIKNNLELKK